MRFEAKTEAQVQEEGLLSEGEYDFEVADASDEVSKKDNEMIKLKLRIYNESGTYSTVFDYLLESMAYKLRHFAYATGLGNVYESGQLLAHDCEGKSGRCKVTIQKAKDGYGPKNTIRDYIVQEGTTQERMSNGQAKAATAAGLDDEIPF